MNFIKKFKDIIGNSLKETMKKIYSLDNVIHETLGELKNENKGNNFLINMEDLFSQKYKNYFEIKFLSTKSFYILLVKTLKENIRNNYDIK